ncbi:MAG: DMT family transporter [Anaerolineales bacterium]|nr:DMT family transporter [Chloroflexota bacterium]MBL6982052.1 DMT family transporter [Anaerolineales bacterium]
MQSIFLVVLIGLLGGVAVAVQASLAGIFSEKVGLVANGLFVFGGGFLFALVVMLFVGGGQIRAWRSVPWYVYLAGPLGIVIISSIGYAIPRIGVASTLTLIVVTQLIIGVMLDHFGWLTIPRPVDTQRLIGIAILFLGTWVVLR